MCENQRMSNSRWWFELTKQEEDWAKIKELYVLAFIDYPLYIHIEPDKSKRPELLRKYLEANFDVAVRHGKGKLQILRYEVDNKENDKPTQNIIGAIFLAPPADDGIAWAHQEDSEYWKAYERENISEDCRKRIIAYETWERDNITAVLRKARTPMFNGLFCALDPKFQSNGIASYAMRHVPRIMFQHKFLKREFIKIPDELQDKLETSRRMKDTHVDQKVPVSTSDIEQSGVAKHDCTTVEANGSKCARYDRPILLESLGHNEINTSNQYPLIAAICHSSFSSYFYQKIGFKHVVQLAYSADNETKHGHSTDNIITHLLLMDTLKTGQVEKIKIEFDE